MKNAYERWRFHGEGRDMDCLLEEAAGVETACFDVYYMLTHLPVSDLDPVLRNHLAVAANRLHGALEAIEALEEGG